MPTLIKPQAFKKFIAMFDISLPAANALFTLSNIVLVVGAVLALVGTIGAIWTSGVRDRYADERIGSNEVKTADAHARASKAEQETETLRQSNITLQTQFERERTERLKLEAKIAPRRLSSEQRAALVASLRNFAGKKVGIWCLVGDVEGGRLARDFVEVFRAAGWDGVSGAVGYTQAIATADRVGIQVNVNPIYKTTTLPEHFRALMAVLQVFGIVPPNAPFTASPETPLDEIVIMIGRKPD